MSDAKAEGEKELFSQVAGTDKLKVANLFSVDGWVCVVTGAGTGIGLVLAAALAENGAKVYITGRRGEVIKQAAEKAKPKSGKGEVIPIQVDCGTKEGIQKLVDTVSAKENSLNLLINNHGINDPKPNINTTQTPEALSKEMFSNETMEHWLHTYQINTASYYFSSWAFLPLLSKSKEKWGEPGNIINTASMSGITVNSQKGQFNYNAGKAATISLSNQLATEFCRRNLGVRVNSVNPGYFPSGMTAMSPDHSDEGVRKYFKEHMGVPLGRAGEAVDITQTFLAAACNRYMTGCNLVVDGGWLLEQQL